MAHAHSLYDTDPHFRIDPVTRNIINMSGKVVLVQHDHNSERFTFEIPRYVDGHDMSMCNKTEVHYINGGSKGKNQGVYPVTDLQVDPNDETYVICSWLVSRNATEYVGPLSFMVRFKCETGETIEYEWGTNIHSGISVSQGIYNSEYIEEQYVDILEQWRLELRESGVTMSGIEQTVISTEDSGINEVTMTFSNGSTGVFKIQNGSRGSKGDAFTYDDFTPEQLAALKGVKGDAFTYSDFTAEQLAALKGAKGDPFTYSDFTAEQLATLKGAKGDAFTYSDFTAEQLKSLTGPAGASIQSIVRTNGSGAAGTIDTYTITLSDGATSTFQVYNGADGEGAGDMMSSIYDTEKRNTDIFKYVDNALSNLEIADEAVFIATYGVTTSTELDAAYNAGKLVVCIHDNGVYAMTTRFSATKHSFDSPFGSTIWNIIVENDVWSEDIENSFALVDHSHDIATATTTGLVMVDGTAGIGINSENGNLFIKGATTSEIDDKQHSYKPITPDNLDYAVKAALVNNANELSDTERTQVLNWICAMSTVCDRKDSGDVTDLLGSDTRRYIFANDVTGMPFDGEWWFVDVISSGSTDITIIATSILTTSKTYIRTACNSVWGDWQKVVTTDSDDYIEAAGLKAYGHVEVSDGNTTMGLYSNGLGSNGDAVWIDQEGDAYFTEVNIGTKDNYKKAATEEYVDNAIANAITAAINNAIGGSY